MNNKYKGYEELIFAKIDFLREERTGQPEVVFCEGKSTDQVIAIMQHLIKNGSNVLGTRVPESMAEQIQRQLANTTYNSVARTIRIMQNKPKRSKSHIVIVSAGTSDLPVVEETYETALFLGNRVEKIVDVGIAGIHRLFDKLEEIRKARVIIVVAGMEGALASVIAGLVDKPVIAVPTSVGYGASFNGISALLSMLNSCTTLSVVNIDNGYGAACQASRINKL
jgi:pyridinium-3,5-biscarboxylic acid mononucleotide synthase